MKIVKIGVVGGVLVAVGLMAAAEPAGGEAAKAVTYAELGKAVRAQRGKVVVVDFWANY